MKSGHHRRHEVTCTTLTKWTKSLDQYRNTNANLNRRRCPAHHGKEHRRRCPAHHSTGHRPYQAQRLRMNRRSSAVRIFVITMSAWRSV